MGRRFAVFALMSIGLAGVLCAQGITDSNPEHKPSVFLGGPKNKKEKNATTRALKGTVVDDTGKPLEGALVTLTDTKANEKNTFITKQDGRFRFDDLSFTTDYEVVARYKNGLSTPRKLSQYDRTVNAVRILEIDPDAPAAAEAKK